jgi:hypothetical protein
MKQSVIAAIITAAALTMGSCATAGVTGVRTTINEQDIRIESLARTDYTILGKVSGEGSVIAPDKLLAREETGMRPLKSTMVKNDTLRYGFLGNQEPGYMTVTEKAIANATYAMIKQAEANGADSVAFVTTRVSVVPKLTDKGRQDMLIPESTVTAKVTAVAIKIKAENQTLLSAPAEEPEDLNPATVFKLNKTAPAETVQVQQVPAQ